MVRTAGNLASNMLVPAYLRNRYLQLVEEFDTEWQPWFMRMMPKQVADGRGSKTYWTRPRMADPQMMAKYYEPDEAIETMNKAHVRPWSYNTRTIGNSFTRTKREWAGDFEGGILERMHAQLLENLSKSINRTIEYTLTRFGAGDTTVMNEFTNQDTNRQGVVDLDAGEFNAAVDAGLGGTRWDDFSGGTPSVFEDLAYMIERFEFMAGQSPTMLAIGRKTALALELNDDLLDRLIRIRDTTQGVLGSSIMGLNIVKVVGQTYKEIPGATTTTEGYPGKGDYYEQDWTHLNKIDMMTEVDTGTRYEWGALSNGSLGEVACGFVDEDHKARGDPTSLFIEQWDERNPKIVWTAAKIETCPVVYDFARIMKIEKTAAQ